MYLEHAGDLRLLLAEKDQAQGTVHCFSLAEGVLFVEAIPQADISRRITAFQYELVPSQGPAMHMFPYLQPGLGNSLHFFLFQYFVFCSCVTGEIHFLVTLCNAESFPLDACYFS